MTRSLAAAAMAAGIVLGTGDVSPVPAAFRAEAVTVPTVSEHRYRIVGRIRLAFFWSRASIVGSARMTAQTTPEGTELTFLLGSDPASAPRQLNQWSYLREEIGHDRAAAFALRTLTPDDLEQLRLPQAANAQLVAASCEDVHAGGIRSLVTRVDGGGATYRMVDRLLDQLAHATQWEERHLPRPAGIAPGLLSAMTQLIGARAVPVSYVYDGTFYDLSVRGTQDVGPTDIESRHFNRLTRVEFAVLNRRTREVTRFAATFAPEAGRTLPVQILFQPSFWVRVELRLDDNADVPGDPAADLQTLGRIRSVCSGAAQRVVHTATGAREPSIPRN